MNWVAFCHWAGRGQQLWLWLQSKVWELTVPSAGNDSNVGGRCRAETLA